ncbi:MAG: hypothetical protein HIU91_16175 [Acidobacteria bacterium]|nr:hypothetical protein [Acidobacteriota bacterium]
MELSSPIRSTVAKSPDRDAVLAVGGGERNPVSLGQLAGLLAVDGAFRGLSLELGEVVGNLLAFACLDGENLLVAVY